MLIKSKPSETQSPGGVNSRFGRMNSDICGVNPNMKTKILSDWEMILSLRCKRRNVYAET